MAKDRSGVRPYGVSLLLAGYTENPPNNQNPFTLYQIDPSGIYFFNTLLMVRLLLPLASNRNRTKCFVRETIS